MPGHKEKKLSPINVNALAAVFLLAVSARSSVAQEVATNTDDRPTSKSGKKLERAEQLHRDAGRLEKIHRIALVPVITQVRFDKDKRLPDPARLRACIDVAKEAPDILTASVPSGKFEFVSGSVVDKAMTDLNVQPQDLFVTRGSATWETPAEVVRGSKQDEAALLEKRDSMKQGRTEMTLYRYKWHDKPDTAIGLASFDQWALPSINTEKAKALAVKLGVDGLLVLDIYDVEVYEGETGFSIFAKRFKSTRTQIYGTLVAADDGEQVWKARARGVRSHQANSLYIGRMKGELEKSVEEGAADAIQMLLSDLMDGTGKPSSK